MIEQLAPALLAFLVTAALLLVLRRPAVQAGLVDRPCPRKRHGRNVPLIGGICILLGFGAALLPVEQGLRDYQMLLAGMVTLTIVGVVDDLVDVSAWSKLGMQVLVVLLAATWGGLTVTTLGEPFGVTLDLGVAAIPFTVVALLGLINAINMFDGLDGLAGGTVAIALGWLTLAGLLGGAGTWPLLSGTLLAAVCAFLVFNLRNPWRRKAASFLGDSGSMTLGFALGWLAIEAGGGPDTVLPPMAIAWVLALPVLDALVLAGRRMARGRNPFTPDREHLHHIFYRAGLTPGQTVSVLLLGSAVLGGIGVVGVWAGVPEGVLALGLVLVAVAHALVHARAWRFATLLRRLLRVLRRWSGRTGRSSAETR